MAALLLGCTTSGFASCNVVNGPTGIHGQVSLVGFPDGSQALKSNELTTEFTFKCDEETNYAMTASVAGAVSGTVDLQSSSGVRVPLNIKLKSINGQKLDLYFKDLHELSYQGHAAAGQNYHAVVELVPAAPRLPRGKVTGLLIGNMRFVIGY